MAEDLRAIDMQIAILIEPKPAIPVDATQHSPLNMWWLGFEYERGAQWFPLSASTDLNAAMRAYEAFREQRPGMFLNLMESSLPPDKRWEGDIEIEDDSNATVFAATPALAICLAILEAAKR